MPKKISQQYDDFSRYSSNISVRKATSRKLQSSFWRFYDDLSQVLLTVLRYTICLPFYYKPERNMKTTNPSQLRKQHRFDCDHDYGNPKSYNYNARCEPGYDHNYKSASPSPSSNFSESSYSSCCSLKTTRDTFQRRNCVRNKKKHHLILRKVFYRRRRRRPRQEKEAFENKDVFVKRKDNRRFEPEVSRPINEYEETSSLEELPSHYDYGDGPQNIDRLRRITDFFNDIYIEQQKLLRKKYAVDEMATKHGITLLRLPPYHCELNAIELVWADVKGYVARNNKTFKMVDVKRLFQEGLTKVTSEKWKNCEDHTIKVEDKMLTLDQLMDDVTERFIINVQDDDDDDDDISEYFDNENDVDLVTLQ